MHRAFTALAVVAAVLCLIGPAAAEIRTGACDCYGGRMVSETPCQCTCPSDEWLPPRCNFQAGSSVELTVYITPRTGRFSSTNFVAAIRTGIRSNAVSFRRRTGVTLTFNGQTVEDVRIVIRGADVNNFLNSVTNGDTFVTQQGIVAADLSVKLPAPTNKVHEVMIYDDGAAVQVSLSGLGFLLGALIIVIMLPCCEMCCCSGYSPDRLAKEWEEWLAARRYVASEDAAAAAASASPTGQSPQQAELAAVEGVPIVVAGEAGHPPAKAPATPPPSNSPQQRDVSPREGSTEEPAAAEEGGLEQARSMKITMDGDGDERDVPGRVTDDGGSP